MQSKILQLLFLLFATFTISAQTSVQGTIKDGETGETIVDHKVPLVEQDNTTQGGRVTAEQIRSLPTKDLNAIAATAAGVSSIDGGGSNIRGGRSSATVYYLDGIRYTGRSIPSSEIEQLQAVWRRYWRNYLLNLKGTFR